MSGPGDYRLPVLAGRLEAKGRTAVLVLSGGNVDAGLYAEILSGRG